MFEWDNKKADENKNKHGISFADTFAFSKTQMLLHLRIPDVVNNATLQLEWMLSVVYFWLSILGEMIEFELFLRVRPCDMR